MDYHDNRNVAATMLQHPAYSNSSSSSSSQSAATTRDEVITNAPMLVQGYPESPLFGSATSTLQEEMRSNQPKGSHTNTVSTFSANSASALQQANRKIPPGGVGQQFSKLASTLPGVFQENILSSGTCKLKGYIKPPRKCHLVTCAQDHARTLFPKRAPSPPPGWSPGLRELFGKLEKSSPYLESQQYKEAFSVIKLKVDLGAHLLFARKLLKYYTTALRANYGQKAIEIRNRLIALLRHHTGTTSDELKVYADELRKEDRLLDAVFFYQASADYFSNGKNGQSAVVGIVNCCIGVRDAAHGLLNRDDSDMKLLVVDQILPLFDEMSLMVEAIAPVSEEFRIVRVAKLRHCVETLQDVLGDVVAREKTCQRALEMLHGRLPCTFMKHAVYGHLTHNLGSTYFKGGRFKDAVECFMQAIAAYELSADLSDAERAERIAFSRRWLEESQKCAAQIFGLPLNVFG